MDEQYETSSVPTLVLFTAPTWCIPCKRLEPHWVKAQDSELLDEFRFVTVDLGETVEETQENEVGSKYNILSVPTILLFSGGRVKEVEARTVVGLIKELT